MKISYKWLNEYFNNTLPEPNKLAETLSLHSYEVEGVEEKDGDFIFDIDVLPNRAHDSLSYWGIAREVAVLLHKEVDIPNDSFEEDDSEKSSDFIKLDVEEPRSVPRAMKRVVLDVEVKESPDWIKEKIIAQGGKPKNNIVDITNLVMWETGQPVHAFDLDKIADGEIEIREAKAGEKIKTLDGGEYELEEGMLVIADSKKPLDIAGIKGGFDSGITPETKRIVLSICNFNPSSIRRTSQKLKLNTDASKRFENGVSPTMTQIAMERLSFLVSKEAQGRVLKEVLDSFPQDKIRGVGEYKIGLSVSEINKVLGSDLEEKDIEEILERFKKYSGFDYEKASVRERISQIAESLVGQPYKYGSSITYDAPNYFDCSSFTAYVYAQAGVSLPRMTADQYLFGAEVDLDSLELGDVVFSKNESAEEDYIERLDTKQKSVHTETKDFMKGTKIPELDHNGIYLGDGKIVHASGKWHKGQVVIEDLKESPAFSNIVGAKRFYTGDDERYVVSIPFQRLDMRSGPGFMVSGNKEDLIEEIGRVSGFYKLQSKEPAGFEFKPKVNKGFYYTEALKDFMVGKGFDEAMNYSFVDSGEVELKNPLAEGKGFLRSTLTEGVRKSADLAKTNKEILGLEETRVFEIGNIHKGGEYTNFVFTIRSADSKEKDNSSYIKNILGEIEKELSIKIDGDTKDNVFEGNLSKAIEGAPEPEDYSLIEKSIISDKKFAPISPYPYITRDIAFWASGDITEKGAAEFIKSNLDSDWVKRVDIFDIYPKDGKISYAIRVVFQSNEKTLSDEEVNEVMDKVYKAVEEKGWETR